MSCECHDSAIEHDVDEAAMKAVYLPQWEAERRVGMIEHCRECVREARGELAAEQCELCPSSRHRLCEFHV